MNQTININELQSNISEVVQKVQNGEIFEVMRYSKPVAVLLSYDDFLSLRGECKRCVEDLRKIAKKAK
ncbi:MAG: type II toxin-antitoxin system prevent-host-death family antitoxin [Patescibacteria group bacterium]|nr:type II toxin-antitoxin system prevent-host-death family antitoxin [Patescibacteria group bacterium]